MINKTTLGLLLAAGLSACATPPAIDGSQLPATPAGFAHDLYATLRALDGRGADVILVEAPPQESAWLGVNDRLRRAAHGSGDIVARLLDKA